MNPALDDVAPGAVTTMLGPNVVATPGDVIIPSPARRVMETDWLNPIPGFTLLHQVTIRAAMATSGYVENRPVQAVQLGSTPPETSYSPIPQATPAAVIRRLVTIALETASGHRPPSKLSPDDFAPVVRRSLTTLSRLSSSPHASVVAGRLIMVHCSTNEVEGERPRFVEFCGTWQARLPRSHQPGRVRILAGKAAKTRTSYRVTTLRFM